VQESLAALQRKGVVRRVPGKSRGLRLARSRAVAERRVPILGLTAAGRPALAIENPDGFLAVDGSWLHGDDVFALTVKGDSMIEAGIFDGDFVFVRRQAVVENGAIALVLVDGEEATIKRVYQHGRQIELRPANQNLEPLVLPADRVQIQGQVIGVFRRLD
jgi:repressor LexA